VATVLFLLLAAAFPALAQEKEGIKVHGHWTIDVRNADGTLASHNEFENALIPIVGQQTLSDLLSPRTSFIGWEVDINPPCCRLVLLEPAVVAAVGTNFSNSTDLAAAPGANGTVVLQGSAQAFTAMSISEVTSRLFYHLNGDTGSVHGSSFTQRSLPQTISVEAGQIVQVTIVFSFS
jgi:hypothetical protein